MRILVDIPDQQIEDLALICRTKKLPRAEVIRQAVAAYIVENQAGAGDAFGLWKQQGIDGLTYQQQLRAEW